MKTLLAALVVIGLLASAAVADTRLCNASRVTCGVCPNTSHAVYSFAVPTTDPDNGGPELAPSVLITEAVALRYGWASQMQCTAMMIACGKCTAPQLGSIVAITKAQFFDFHMCENFFADIRWYNVTVGVDAARATAEAKAPPVIVQ